MAKLQTRYICRACGHESPKWMGRCPECEAWDTFIEEVFAKEKPGASQSAAVRSLRSGDSADGSTIPIPITSVEMMDMERISCGIGELDRVLGGGLVAGGVVLVGGDPGIGKSTLLTQAAACLANPSGNIDGPAPPARTVLYFSGEESARQIRLRSARLNAESPDFLISVETEIGAMLHHLANIRPALAIVDSIQTVSDSSLDSAPGSVGQVRACAHHLAKFAKAFGIPIVLIGHVTKDGNIAGPRVLEHVVDTVLYFEGDRHHAYRLLRAVKNRFGSSDELGIFEMSGAGLIGVENPSAALLSERSEGGNGSAVVSIMEGSRALLVEVQALAARSTLASPRRTVTGMDPNRVSMLLAVLEKRLGMRLAEQDVYVNVAGGIRITEPASDLAALAAVASNFREQAVHPQTVVLGEVGLAGEVRAVSQVEKRLREAARQGFTRAIISRHNAAQLPGDIGIEIIVVSNVSEAINAALQPGQTRQ